MKKLSQTLIIAFVLFAGVAANAQSKTETENFYIGKWKLMVFGLPNGDTEMILKIEKKDGELTGTIGAGNGSDTPLSKAGINKNTLEFNFIGNGFNVPVYLDKKGDKKVEGSMNDMFDIQGTKIE